MALVTQTDITAIQGWAGDYREQIVEQVFQGLDIADDITLMQNVETPEILPKYVANDGLRPYSVNVTDSNGQSGSFSQRTIVPRTAMKILTVIPEELRKTYLARGLKANAKEYPKGFAQYFWSSQTKKLADEINRNAYFSIDPETIQPFNPASTYAVGDRVKNLEDYYQAVAITQAGESPVTTPVKWKKITGQCLGKGLGTIIAEEYAGMAASHKIATGVITDANAFDKIRSFYQGMATEHKALGGFIYVSYSVFENYQNALLAKFTNGTSFLEVANDPGMYVYGSAKKWIVKPCTWMSTSQRMIATQKENLIMGTDLYSDLNTIGNMIPTIHGYVCKFQLILCWQIVDLDTLYVNDQV